MDRYIIVKKQIFKKAKQTKWDGFYPADYVYPKLVTAIHPAESSIIKRTAAQIKERKKETQKLAGHLKNIVQLDTHSQVLSREIRHRLPRKQTATVSSAYTSQEVGYAMRAAFPDDTNTWRTHKIGPPPTRERGYRGVRLVA